MPPRWELCPRHRQCVSWQQVLPAFGGFSSELETWLDASDR
jgi:hypothetical protein